MFIHKSFGSFLENARLNKRDLVSVKVTNAEGSTYAKVGSRMLVDSQGNSIGVLGGESLQNNLIKQELEHLEKKEVGQFVIDQRGEGSTHGVTEYLIEPLFFSDDFAALELPSVYNLLIFGNDQRSQALIALADIMGWKITTIHDGEVDSLYIKKSDKVIRINSYQDISSIDLSPYNAAVILSHKFDADCAYLKALQNSQVEYIGVMGNKREVKNKIEATDANLFNDTRLFAPIGLDISTHSHESIALATCAQIEARKNGKI